VVQTKNGLHFFFVGAHIEAIDGFFCVLFRKREKWISVRIALCLLITAIIFLKKELAGAGAMG
jgi:hypothetical protein